MPDAGELLMRIFERSQAIKEEQTKLKEDKELLETMFIGEKLNDWVDADDACRCEGFSVARQVRKTWIFSEETEDLAAKLKAAQEQEKGDGTALGVSGAVSWVVRPAKAQPDQKP